MEPIKDLKCKIDLIDYLCSETHILIEQTNNHIRSHNEPEDTREPDSYYPFFVFIEIIFSNHYLAHGCWF